LEYCSICVGDGIVGIRLVFDPENGWSGTARGETPTVREMAALAPPDGRAPNVGCRSVPVGAAQRIGQRIGEMW